MNHRQLLAHRAYTEQQQLLQRQNPGLPSAYVPRAPRTYGNEWRRLRARQTAVLVREAVFTLCWFALAFTGVLLGLWLTGGAI